MTAARFGFFFWPWSPEYTSRMARLAERDGWDLLGIADTPGNAMDLWVALTLAATRTERVGLAACVTNLATRHPAITAGAAASVDAVSGGRVLLGVVTAASRTSAPPTPVAPRSATDCGSRARSSPASARR